MIDLSSEPSLGSMILTKDGDLRYSYVLPRGMTFPTGSEAVIKFTDRASNPYTLGVYGPGSLSDDLTTFSWSIPSAVLNAIKAGDNFEVSVTIEEGTYKVRYGRVVRKEVSYPLLPGVADDLPNSYSDNMSLNAPNNKWIPRYGEVAMTNNSPLSGNPYVMGARNRADIFGIGLSLWASAAVSWYAPLQSDNIEINVGLVKYNANTDGDLTVVFSSNQNMTKFLGVRFTDPPGLGGLQGDVDIDIVYGTSVPVVTGIGGPDAVTRYELSTVASNFFQSSGGATFKIQFTNYTTGGSEGPPVVPGVAQPRVRVTGNLGYPYGTRVLFDRDVSAYYPNRFETGVGYRYLGLIFNGSLATQGPLIHEWAARDLL
jgi:hypothetical protein